MGTSQCVVSIVQGPYPAPQCFGALVVHLGGIEEYESKRTFVQLAVTLLIMKF